jgi:hypothetical protein
MDWTPPYWNAADAVMRSPDGQDALRSGWGVELFHQVLYHGQPTRVRTDDVDQLRLAAAMKRQFFQAVQDGPEHPLSGAVLALGRQEQELTDQLRAHYLRGHRNGCVR